MARPKRWKYGPVVDGVCEVRLHSFRYFYDFITQKLISYRTYIFRGHRREDWKLESTLDRLMVSSGRPDTPEARRSHLTRFKYAVRGRRGQNPPRIPSENEWWSLGQHFGLATPLLDWTASPFVAAYFAYCSDAPDRTKDRVVLHFQESRSRERARKLE
jgi:hypothetical protein